MKAFRFTKNLVQYMAACTIVAMALFAAASPAHAQVTEPVDALLDAAPAKLVVSIPTSGLYPNVAFDDTNGTPSISRQSAQITQASVLRPDMFLGNPARSAAGVTETAALSSHLTGMPSLYRKTLSAQSQDSGQTAPSPKPKHKARKGFLILGIAGTAMVGGGIVDTAIYHSPVPPGGIFLLSVGAVAAGIGYFFAFHHH